MPKPTVMLLTALLCACMSTPPTPQDAVCFQGFIATKVGTSAADPTSLDLPNHVDIVRTETRLDRQTLTAIFHLKHLPDTIVVNRPHMPFLTFEYFYSVNIDISGDPIHRNHLADYTLAAFHETQDADPSSTSLQHSLVPVLWRNVIEKQSLTIHVESVPTDVELRVSPANNTLTLIANVPNISPNSTVLFTAEDYLGGMDAGSCEAD